MAGNWPVPVPEDVLSQICREMEEAEKSGELDNLFKRQQSAAQSALELPDRTSLLNSIKPDMKLYKSTFKRIYGYELSFPGFAETALTELEKAGCSRAREYYSTFVTEYEQKHEKEMKNVAEWYRKQIDKGRGEKSWENQQEAEPQKTALHQKSDRELLTLLQKLKAENAL